MLVRYRSKYYTEKNRGLLMSSNTTLENLFKEYKASLDYDSRLIWDEGVVKIANGGNPTLRPILVFSFPMILAIMGVIFPSSIIDILPVFTSEDGTVMSADYFFYLSLFVAFALGSIVVQTSLKFRRGQRFLIISDEKLEIRYDKKNVGPGRNSVLISDVAAIENYSRTTTTTDSEGGSFTRTFLVTGIVMINPKDDRSLENTKFGIPLVEFRSNTITKSENLANALNFLIFRK
jgi:hypothetical protein